MGIGVNELVSKTQGKLSAALVLFKCFIYGSTTVDKVRMWLSYEVLLVMSTVFFCVVFLVPNNNVLLANRFGDFIGKISYSLYLLHMPIITKVNQLQLSIEIKLLLSLVLSVLVAFLSYQYFERPIANLIRRNVNFRAAS